MSRLRGTRLSRNVDEDVAHELRRLWLELDRLGGGVDGLTHQGERGTAWTLPWSHRIHVVSVTANFTLTVDGAGAEPGKVVSLWLHNASGAARTVTLSGVDFYASGLASGVVVANGALTILHLEASRNADDSATVVAASRSHDSV